MGFFTSGRRRGFIARSVARAHSVERLEPRTLLATFVVTNVENTGAGSLRQAILDANGAAGADVITFNIPGPGPHVIQPRAVNPADPLTAPMPISGPVLIDGYTQATASPNTLAAGNNAQIRVQIDGALAPAGVAGLFVDGSGVTIRGLSITRFYDGIILRGGGGSTIAGNFIGITPGGAAAGNADNGISIEGSPVNTIGGTSPADRNVISANGVSPNGIGVRLTRAATVDTFIQGNYIGTDLTGTVDMGNGGPGVFVGVFNTAQGYASRTKIGGTEPGARNLISGNRNGVVLLGAPARDNVIQGNYIGTTVTGAAPLGNDLHGVLLTFPGGVGASSNNLIGGTDAGAGNVISGNGRNGIFLVGTAINNVIQGNFIGTNFAGNTDVGNLLDGILIQDGDVNGPTGNLIGGNVAAAMNVISGNDSDGIEIANARTGRNIFQRNRIGIAANDLPLGNGGHGVFINGASNQVIGYDGAQFDVATTANIIARNGLDGVSVVTGTQNRISGNAIYGNAAGGIDLGNDGPTRNDENDVDTGANTLLNSPRITETLFQSNPAGVRLTGHYQGAPGAAVRVEFFRNPFAENLGVEGGKQYLGFRDYVVDADGTIPFTAVFASNQFVPGDKFTAIALDGAGNTSEFASEIDLSPLDVTGNFALNSTSGLFESTGTVEIGHIGGGPKVRVEGGRVAYNQSTIQANGTFSVMFGGARQTLFNGSVTIAVGTNEGTLIAPVHSLLPPDLHPGALPVDFDSITFELNEIRLGGSFDLPQGLGGFTIDLEDAHYFVVAPEGLLMSGLALTIPDTSTTFFSTLRVDITDMAIAFNAETNALKLQGKFKLKGIFGEASVTADLSGENYIEITPAGVNFRGTIAVEDIAVAEGLFGLKGISLTLAIVDGVVNELGGSATVVFPGGREGEAEIGIKRVEGDLQLDLLRLKGDDLGVPIGTSGAQFQMAEVTLKDLAVGEPQATFGGKLGFSYGPEFDITLPAVFGGATFDDVSLIGVELSVEGLPLNVFNFDVGSLVLIASGTVTILGGVAEGTVTAEFNFPEGAIKLETTFTALAGFITSSTSISADSNLNLTGFGTASIQVPLGIPVIGGLSLAGGSAYLQYRHNGTFADDYIAGYAEMRWFGVTFRMGQKVNFDGTTTLLSAAPLPPALGAASVAGVSVQAAGSGAFMVAPGTESILLSAGWPNAAAGSVPFRIIAPDGTVYVNADSGGGKIELVPELTNSKRLTVAVRLPAAGRWTMELTNIDALGAPTFDGAAPLPAPTIALTAPAGTQAAHLVGVTYAAQDANPGAAVSLFYDTDGAGFDGKSMAAGLSTGQGLTYPWDTSTVPPGDYRVYGIVSDNSGAPAFAYAPGVVQVRAPRVTDVFVSGTAWTTGFKQYLAANGVGDADAGFRILAGPTDPLPWANLDRISIRFDRPVAAEVIDLAVRGINVIGYAVNGFTYNAGTRTATWTLSSPIRGDRIRLDLNADTGGLAGPGAGGALDGEWAGAASSFPSGNGIPGGDFLFDMNILPADVTRSGSINALDLMQLRARLNASTVRPGAGGYSAMFDLNGDGRINVVDWAIARSVHGRALPPPPPAAAMTALRAPGGAVMASVLQDSADWRDRTATPDRTGFRVLGSNSRAIPLVNEADQRIALCPRGLYKFGGKWAS